MNAIEVHNISKLYRLGAISTGNVSHDINRWWHQLRGLPDPYAKIAESNARDNKKGDSDYVWSLKDISFNVKQGEILGVIGKNGAGKSTLLKILSKITAPTTGSIKLRGRVASLLEVGTGFHPELTGRENIYQNGAILGMNKREITSKFDEIVDFSGVARYVDTPVKRYSSGMYMRLAFAIAAHLEPEILVVDEVLAVGDAEFQKKCLGKMKSVSENDGRTVLFVSHNMTAVQSLCNSAILLKQGELILTGEARQVVKSYLSEYSDHMLEKSWEKDNAPANDFARLRKVQVIPQSNDDVIKMGESFQIEFHFETFINDMEKIDLGFFLYDELGNMVFDVSSEEAVKNVTSFSAGYFVWNCQIPGNLMHEGTYNIGRLMFLKNLGTLLFETSDILRFDIINTSQRMGWMGHKQGIVKPKMQWTLNKLD